MKSLLSFLLTSVLILTVSSQILDFSKVVYDTLNYVVDTAATMTGVREMCPFVDDAVPKLQYSLPMVIKGQEMGLNVILKSFDAWEFSRQGGNSDSFVLAITGPTGVGKSETAFRIAETLLSRKTRIGTSKRFTPVGYLVLRGEEYSENSDAYLNGGLAEVLRRISKKMGDHLDTCGGQGVVVFDEVQKVVPGTLNEFTGALKEKGVYTVVRNRGTNIEQIISYDMSNMIFIFVSDIGSEVMIPLLLKYGDRNHIPQQAIRNEVKKALDAQWESLNFGHVVNEVVPFLPLEQPQIEAIMRLKLTSMAMEYRGRQWLDVVVDDEVVSYLSGPKFVRYTVQSGRVSRKNGGETVTEDRDTVLATYGGRGIDKGPLQDLKSVMKGNLTPWRPNKVLHIGMNVAAQQGQIYMEWCSLKSEIAIIPSKPSDVLHQTEGFKEGLFASSGESSTQCQSDSCVKQDGVQYEKCEKMWTGDIQGL